MNSRHYLFRNFVISALLCQPEAQITAFALAMQAAIAGLRNNRRPW
jgi:hypothetical protein